MATVPKAEMNIEAKQEPKEQREPKKPGSPKLDSSSPKGSPSLERKQPKENSPKNENSPNKLPDQVKSPGQKNPVSKEASSPVKKENPPSAKSIPEQPKSPEQKIAKEVPSPGKKESGQSPKSNPEQPKSPELKKSEKKDLATGDKDVTQLKVAETKTSSPDKNSPKKPSPDKVNSPNGNSPSTDSTKPPDSKNNLNTDKSSANGKATKNIEQPTNDNSKAPDKKDKITSDEKEKTDGVDSSKSVINTEINKTETKLKPAVEPISSENRAQKTVGETMKKEINGSSNKPADEEKNDAKTQEESDSNNNKQSEEKEKSPSKNGTHESKNKLRMEIWNKMFRSSLLAFRKPCNYRIPHFKGDIISAGRLSTLEIFQKAKTVKVSLDKAHECVRLQVIEAGKEMIVGCPGLREAVFLHVKPPMEPSKSSNKLASSKIGIGHIGMALDFSSGVQADLVIVGSVAVDKTGLRVGKGEGFADLEYALLKKLGGIAPNAPVVTVVHDSQVYDTLPENLFKEHDVPADYIVTPTQVIEITPKRNHPDLIWNLLSSRRVNSIPIIKQLLDREQNRDGATILLKDEDTDSEELEQIAKRKRYFMRRRTYSTGSQRGRGQMVNGPNNNRNDSRGRIRRHTAPSERTFQQKQQQPGMMLSPQLRPTRNFRSRAASIPRYNFIQQQNMKQNRYWVPMKFQNGNRQRRSRLQMFRPKYSVDFSVKVQGLTNEMRVRDLKSAIKQRGVRPRDISWLPHKGLAFLHFSLPKNNQESQPTIPLARDTDSVLATLKDLMVKTENGPETNVQVEAAAVPMRKVHFTV